MLMHNVGHIQKAFTNFPSRCEAEERIECAQSGSFLPDSACLLLPGKWESVGRNKTARLFPHSRNPPWWLLAMEIEEGSGLGLWLRAYFRKWCISKLPKSEQCCSWIKITFILTKCLLKKCAFFLNKKKNIWKFKLFNEITIFLTVLILRYTKISWQYGEQKC